MDWFQYDNGLRHERVNKKVHGNRIWKVLYSDMVSNSIVIGMWKQIWQDS